MANQQQGAPSPKCNWFRFRSSRDVEGSAETKNLLLVIVTLIAAVTFQAGVNPPGGVWQDDEKNHKAGRAIYAQQPVAFTVFLTANTLALSLAIQVIILLTYKFPFRMELWIATISMFATYASAIFAVAPNELVKYRFVLSAGALPFVFQLPYVFQLIKKMFQWIKKKYQGTSFASESSSSAPTSA